MDFYLVEDGDHRLIVRAQTTEEAMELGWKYLNGDGSGGDILETVYTQNEDTDHSANVTKLPYGEPAVIVSCYIPSRDSYPDS